LVALDVIYCFGTFRLDASSRTLTREAAPIPLPDRHVDVLLRLLAHPGETVDKEALVQAAWPDVAVTDNSLEQAISTLRKHAIPIDTVPRRGYRLTGEVTREVAAASDADLDALLAPHRAWLEGRAALETLAVQNVAGAARAFASVLEASPHHAAAHVGLANALIFRFEASRVDESPDVEALAAAVPHAREACRIDPGWAEGWATLGLALHRAGQPEHGIAAAQRAVELEADNWRHQLRLAFITWGESRLRAAQRTLRLMPGLGLAHWLAASVHIARQAFDAADREIAAGTAVQDEPRDGAKFASVGLHWLAGLLDLMHGDNAAAADHFDRELTFERSGHLYARECSAATCYAKGALALHEGDRAAAAAAFATALTRVPRHPLALAALAGMGEASDQELSARLETAAGHGADTDVAIARAVRTSAGRHDVDPTPVLTALRDAVPGAAGWLLPVDPVLRCTGDSTRWGATLAVLGSRAS
jgi:DNA-binding winged helix-turn-helix (wHTH) protein